MERLVTVNDLNLGDSASSVTWTNVNMVHLFAELVGDWSPFHFDAEFCYKYAPFGAEIVHGMLLGGLISGVLSSLLPGGLYVRQILDFRRPVFIGDVVETRAVIIAIDHECNRVIVETTCRVITFGKRPYVAVSGEAIASPFVNKQRKVKNEDSWGYSSEDEEHQTPW